MVVFMGQTSEIKAHIKSSSIQDAFHTYNYRETNATQRQNQTLWPSNRRTCEKRGKTIVRKITIGFAFYLIDWKEILLLSGQSKLNRFLIDDCESRILCFAFVSDWLNGDPSSVWLEQVKHVLNSRIIIWVKSKINLPMYPSLPSVFLSNCAKLQNSSMTILISCYLTFKALGIIVT